MIKLTLPPLFGIFLCLTLTSNLFAHPSNQQAYVRFFGPSSASTTKSKATYYYAVRCVTRSQP